MNKLILDSILKRIEKQETKLIVSSLTYYSILAIIPTIILSVFVLRFFNNDTYSKYGAIIEKISLNNFTNIIVTSVTIYMIARAFHLIIKKNFSLIKSSIYSILFAFIFILFLTTFLYIKYIESPLLSAILEAVLIFLFSFTIIHFFSKSKLRYSILISLLFSLVANIFIFVFTAATTFFINYENYYGIFAPIFLLILALNIFIYMITIAYICAEEFTNFSNIKILKG